MASKAFSLVACANSVESLCISTWGLGLELLLLAPSFLGASWWWGTPLGPMDLRGVILVRAILQEARLTQLRQSNQNLKSSQDGLQTQPRLTTQPRLRVKEVTSELIMMHESFLRTKTSKLIKYINNSCFYIGHNNISTPPHKAFLIK